GVPVVPPWRVNCAHCEYFKLDDFTHVEQPKPAKPEPKRIIWAHETRGAGGEVAAAADGALPRAPRRGALLLRPDHRHRNAARGLLCEGDDGVSFCAADPGLRLSAICRTAS